MNIKNFREIMFVNFDSDRATGEPPVPTRLMAREFRTGREWRLEQETMKASAPPYPFGPDVLVVTYDAPTQLGCYLALGWPLPGQILDLHAEFRCETSGLVVPRGYELPGALAHFGLEGDGVDGLAKLLPVMLPGISLGHALLRGRYTAAVARMEAVGIPIDLESFERLRAGWAGIQDALIERVDGDYGVYANRKFNPFLWRAWLNRNGIRWPRHPDGKLELNLDTFRDMAQTYPEVRPMKELRASLSLLRSFQLAVGSDGRNRCPLSPFASKTGRNQPSTSKFIFGPATWLRGLIKPPEGMALAYVDYEQQEFGIAAALSGDLRMMDAYASGDPYLEFAKQAGAVPPDATKASHREERERFKLCALGVQYGMGARSLAIRLDIPDSQAQEILRMHKTTYPLYWEWSKEVETQAFRDGKLQAALGWRVHLGEEPNSRSLRNFPLQANGAEMLRLACIKLTEAGVSVCAPVHDALLIEAPVEDIEQTVALCQNTMQLVSAYVLRNFRLRTEAKVVRFPDRFKDDRGQTMWENVFGLLDQGTFSRCA